MSPEANRCFGETGGEESYIQKGERKSILIIFKVYHLGLSYCQRAKGLVSLPSCEELYGNE